ncbi:MULTISPECIES: MarR family winged helix-turn-helix transcriptional regulator [unclassified Microbacterium]|uniref:MarR family winged helix-turn-helix transcriptional regulator n=1 Tax=unclassified Microbacterium TaxID=2609290 RepID=UPI000EAA4845|nr:MULTISPECIES: MarR family transcriptional regulator [unclassified Microbacterium]MBT2483099.1 MarR family transcriptional regulator [Microbacterium sp. ISL-108]RKN66161.1 MarR family transcriptional regulator [Microbacterium sp. CGR2]
MPTSIVDKLMAITSMFQQDMARAFAGTPLTESRVAVLWTLALSGPSTQQTLSEALSVTPRNISGLVDALEQHGYVRRVPHPSDRRAVLVTLTPNGEAAVARMQEEHAHLEVELRDAVAPEHLDALEQGIEAIIARLATLVSAEQPAAEDG